MRSDLGVFLKAQALGDRRVRPPTGEPLAAQLVEVVPKRGAPTVPELGRPSTRC
ncbi:hypothetical protein [Nonomuraea sp. NPDC049607]|uniref:hypothetical protein n=1 Tax=unclassified Nonomuraea TaxID=2593643 RepID=UPI00344043C4